MVGYHGKSYLDAAVVLLRSQGTPARGFRDPGHARGHAMVALGEMIFLGSKECIEYYSTNAKKCGFVNREEQDLCLHYCLTTEEARTAMEKLNTGSLSETVEIDIRDMDLEMVRYVDGNLVSWAAAMKAVLVLRHQAYNDDVHVQTFYPVPY